MSTPPESRLLDAVTTAGDAGKALEILDAVRSRATLRAVADLLYIDPSWHSYAWLKREIVKEARA
jgi:hypothetical protein